ncbi:MoaD/ThiS family protein [Puia sp.]|jgi:molybdopterin synthase sulfur carrier subunit|uniref:MoaD/ThiS family protein n=1 Tax=Puia sp. TaxID=2045100 RepID=UPI002F3FA084
MKIHVYAGLKDYFQPEFEVSEPVTNTDELKAHLLTLNDKAGDILSSCRFAVEEGFIDNAFKLKEHDTIVIIPPASGG